MSLAKEAGSRAIVKCTKTGCTCDQDKREESKNIYRLLLSESRVDHCERLFSFHVSDLCDTDGTRKSISRQVLDGAGRRGRPGSGLRISGRTSRVKRNVALDLLHYLMNVAIKNGYGSKTLEKAQGLLGIFGTPAPLRIDGPEWHVSKNDDRRARTQTGYVLLQPIKLVLA